jgi:hypothetical protein
MCTRMPAWRKVSAISVDKEPKRMRVSVGRLVIGLDDEAGASASASGELDPCPVTRGDGPVDIDISRGSDVAPPLGVERAGDGGDGWISALAVDGLYLMRQGGGACVVDGRPGELPLCVTTDGALPTRALMRGVLRPLLQLGLPARGAGTVHAAAVARPGAGVLIAGWSESGKTEVALALAERGWSILADKWTVLDAEGRMAPFPVRAGIRGWVLKYLPQLRAAIPVGARWRMGAASRTRRGIERVADSTGSALTAAALDVTRRACAQGERLSVTLSELREMYGFVSPEPAHPPLTLVVVLRTVANGQPVARPLDAQTALRRLHESAAYERRDGLGLLLRRRFAGGEDAVLHATTTERELLSAALSDVPLIEIACPFPSDPRLVGDLIEAHL